MVEDEKPTKAALSKERVIAAAARIFHQLGYAGTTMRAVADAAGLQAGSLYYHYPSKADLVAAILETSVRLVSSVVINTITTLPPSASYLDRLRAAMSAHLRALITYEDYSLVSRRVFGQVPPEVKRKHMRDRNAYTELWHKLLEAGRDAGEFRADLDVKLTTRFILGAINSASEWHQPTDDTLEQAADEFFKLISAGLVSDRVRTSGAQLTRKTPAKSSLRDNSP
jgi:TetR/AcrR family transcriptional regulator, cholesterol catabolism regulator